MVRFAVILLGYFQRRSGSFGAIAAQRDAATNGEVDNNRAFVDTTGSAKPVASTCGVLSKLERFDLHGYSP